MLEELLTAQQSKLKIPFKQQFVSALLAGAFIALGATLFTFVSSADASDVWVKLASGLSFCLGLILVMVIKVELFTGNNLLSMSLLSKKSSPLEVLRNWCVVYSANFLGSLIIAFMLFLAGTHFSDGGAFGARALAIAGAKVSGGFISLFVKGVLCNILVCLAIVMAMVAKDVTGKVLAILFPITAFVALGFEHSVANMFFIPMGMIVKNWSVNFFWDQIQLSPDSYTHLNLRSFLLGNLLPVTLGNIVGGSFFVGVSLWFTKKQN
jgi:formate/nitrite transporter